MGQKKSNSEFFMWYRNLSIENGELMKRVIIAKCGITRDIFRHWLYGRTKVPYLAQQIINEIAHQEIFKTKDTKIMKEKQLSVCHVSARPSGYGHYLITVELEYDGNYKTFNAMTDNMSGLDEAKEIEDYDERALALYKLIDYKISDSVEKWIQDLCDENKDDDGNS